MIRVLVDFPALTFLVANGQDANDPDPKWTAHGLSVTRASPGEQPSPSEQGTRVTATLELPGRRVVAVDGDKTRVDRFTDDRGTDLLAGLPQPRPRPWGVMVNHRMEREAGKYLNVTFFTPGHPARGATKVRVSGKVTLLVGKGERKLEAKVLALRDGLQLDFGKFYLQPYEVFEAFDRHSILSGWSEYRPRRWSDYVAYRGTKPLKDVQFIDSEGREVSMRQSGPKVHRTDQPAKEPFEARFFPVHTGPRFDRETTFDRGTLRVTYFDTTEIVEVPVNLEVGPGL